MFGLIVALGTIIGALVLRSLGVIGIGTQGVLTILGLILQQLIYLGG